MAEKIRRPCRAKAVARDAGRRSRPPRPATPPAPSPQADLLEEEHVFVGDGRGDAVGELDVLLIMLVEQLPRFSDPGCAGSPGVTDRDVAA